MNWSLDLSRLFSTQLPGQSQGTKLRSLADLAYQTVNDVDAIMQEAYRPHFGKSDSTYIALSKEYS